MNEYVECLVSRKRSGASKVLAGLMIGVTVLLVLVMIAVPAAMILAIITGVTAYLINYFSNVEYEYLYLDKEITVDKIMSQSRRKTVATYSVDRMEVFAPVKSWHLDGFKNRDVTTKDYSIGEELQPDERYVMYYEGGLRVVLSPSPEFVKAILNAAPRKAFKD